MFSAADHAMMTRALRLAEQGLYTTTPNPRVGCVIVKDGVVIGQGAHLKAGEPHAEVYALREAGTRAQGADVYVTLEPCSHFGRTPPCAEALLQAGVRRVIAAMQDPNPLVSGRGLNLLQSQGVETAYGLMQAEAAALNQGFISRMTRSRPYVRSKIAASLDGRTALANGVSQWITGAAARRDVQHWRAQSCAILTGSGTVMADDPQLSVRDLETGALKGRQPLRVIVDSQLQVPLASRVLSANTVVAHTSAHSDKTALQSTGAELMYFADEAEVPLPALLETLAARGLNDLMVEAGQGLNGALLAAGLIDEFVIYMAPMLLGSAAQGMFAIPALTQMQDRVDLEIFDVRQIGNDIRIRAKPQAR